MASSLGAAVEEAEVRGGMADLVEEFRWVHSMEYEAAPGKWKPTAWLNSPLRQQVESLLIKCSMKKRAIRSSLVEETMTLPVSLCTVVDEMEMLGGEAGMHAFLNRHTGEFYGGTAEQLAKAEDDEEDQYVPDWEVEIIQRLREVLASPDWLELPRRDSHEDFRMMERFCSERCEGQLQEDLLSVITGRRAFSRFKDTIHRHGVQQAWYTFRQEQLEEEAKAWLEAHKIAFKP